MFFSGGVTLGFHCFSLGFLIISGFSLVITLCMVSAAILSCWCHHQSRPRFHIGGVLCYVFEFSTLF